MGERFGSFLRERRLELMKNDPGFSIRRLAQRIGVHHSYLSRIERGEPVSLTNRKIVALAKELGEDPDVLLGMNGKVSQEMQRAVLEQPELFGKLLRGLRKSLNMEGTLSSTSFFDPEYGDANTGSSREKNLAHAYDTIIRQNALLESVFHSTPNGMAFLDRQGRFIKVNSTFASCFNLSPAALSGTLFDELPAPFLLSNALRRVLESGRVEYLQAMPRDDETETPPTNGPAEYWDWRFQPLLSTQGELQGVILTIVDVSGHVRLLQEQMRASRHTKLVAEQVDDVLWVVDARLNMLFVSPSVRGFLGREQGEMLGGNWRSFVETESLRSLMDQHKRFDKLPLKQRMTHPLRLDLRVRHKDGRTLWAETLIRPMCDEGSRSCGYLGVARDIGPRKAAEQAIRDERNQLKTILDHSPNIAFLKDQDKRFVLVNKRFEEAYGLSLGEVIGKTIFDLQPRDIARQLDEVDDMAITTRQALTRRCVHQTPMGQDYRLTTRTPVVDADGQVRALCGYCATIDRQLSKAALSTGIDTERILHHNLKSPIYSILSGLSLLLEDANLSDFHHELLRDMQRSSRRILSMISLSLNLFKMELGSYEPALSIVDLSTLLAELTEQALRVSSHKKLKAEILIDGRPVEEQQLNARDKLIQFPLLTDNELVYPMFSNLLENAVEASPPTASSRFPSRQAIPSSSSSTIGAPCPTAFARTFSTSTSPPAKNAELGLAPTPLDSSPAPLAATLK